MAKKIELDVDVNSNVEGSIRQLKELKKQLKETAVGSDEFKKIFNQIDDLEDKIKGAKGASSDWIDTLAGASGPVGSLGRAINGAKVATTSFGAAVKATGIGLLVSVVGGLVAAFSQVEGAGKKLEPLMIGLQKILGGIFELMQPLLDTFVDLATKALPYVTEYIGKFYSSLVALFTLVKEAGIGVGKILKGIFTLDYKSLEEGYKQLTGSWDKTVKSFTDGMERYEAGTKKMTAIEKKNLEDRAKARQDALAKQLKMMDTQDKLDAARLEKMKQEALALAETEQEKLDIEKKFFDLSYQARKKDIEDKQKLYKKDSQEWKDLQVTKMELENEFIAKSADFKKRQKDITEKNNKEIMDAEISALDLKKANGEIKEYEYQKSVYEIKKKYLTEKKDLEANEVAFAQATFNEKKRLAEEERGITFQLLQDKIDALDRENQKKEDDFLADNERLMQEKSLLEQQRDLELQAAEDNNLKQLEIKKKYADALYNIDTQITNNAKAQAQQRIEILNAYADIVGQFGNFLQQVAGKNKSLAKAGLVLEQAAGVAKIVINTQANAAKAGYLTPKGIAELVAGGIGVATAIAATVKGLRQIDASDSGSVSGGGGDTNPNSAGNLGRNYATGGLIGGKRHSQGGTMIEAEAGEAIMTRGAVTMFGPLLSAMNSMGGGTTFGNQMFIRQDKANVNNPQKNQAPVIMKTYVVSNELTSEAEKQAKLKDLSTL